MSSLLYNLQYLYYTPIGIVYTAQSDCTQYKLEKPLFVHCDCLVTDDYRLSNTMTGSFERFSVLSCFLRIGRRSIRSDPRGQTVGTRSNSCQHARDRPTV